MASLAAEKKENSGGTKCIHWKATSAGGQRGARILSYTEPYIILLEGL